MPGTIDGKFLSDEGTHSQNHIDCGYPLYYQRNDLSVTVEETMLSFHNFKSIVEVSAQPWSGASWITW